MKRLRRLNEADVDPKADAKPGEAEIDRPKRGLRPKGNRADTTTVPRPHDAQAAHRTVARLTDADAKTIPRVNETEWSILGALSPKELYGLQIISEVKRLTDGKRTISLGGLYTNLHMMEEKKLVEGRWGETTEERQGARRRYYKITGLGARALDEKRAEMIRVLRLAPGWS